MSITTWLLARKIARLERRRADRLDWAEQQRRRAVELSLQAYYLDQFASPLAWGRTQNAANWARHVERVFRQEAADLEREIAALDKRSPKTA